MGTLRPLIRRNGVERALFPCRSFACSRSATTAEKAYWARRPRSSHPHSRDEVTPTSRTALVFHAFFFGWLRSLRYSRSIKICRVTHIAEAPEKAAVSKPSSSCTVRVSYASMPYLSFYQICRAMYTHLGRQHRYYALNPSNLCRSKPMKLIEFPRTAALRARDSGTALACTKRNNHNYRRPVTTSATIWWFLVCPRLHARLRTPAR
jgi:hypothetical protein